MKNHQTKQDIQVLIIEDDLRIAEINRRFVEKVKGYQVIGIAADEEQAKEELEILKPDLVLLDIYFPDMNGLELLRYIKQNHTCDVIMITAAKEVDAFRDALRNGAYDFIIKPIIFDRFQQTMQNYQNFRTKLEMLENGKGQIDQEEIDQLIQGPSKPTHKEITHFPKGIDKLTLEKITKLLKNQTVGMTTEQVGQEIGTSRCTARRYLEYLVQAGEATADLHYGAVGRPERVYNSVRSMYV